MTTTILSRQQDREMEITRTGLMMACPFYAYYFYDQVIETPDNDCKTAATDGKRLYYSPSYFSKLKPGERIFGFAHEMSHITDRHPQRMKFYQRQGHLRGLPFVPKFFNRCADYIINADLIRNKIGDCNPSWLYRADITGDELVEDVYERLWKEQPPQPQDGPGQPCNDGEPGDQPGDSPYQMPPPRTYGERHRGIGKPDEEAQANGGSFDELLEPKHDPVTGRDDVPDEAEFKEAIARAAAAAEQAGNLPGNLKRKIKEILEPQIAWQEEIRLLMTGKCGHRGETWNTLNKRRLAVSINAMSRGEPFLVMPGRKGYGAENLAVVVDTSGSISDDMIQIFRNEIGGILNDVKPRNLYVIWCDAAVAGVDIVGSLDEARELTPKGGGGTSFEPPFRYLEDEHIRPEALIYLTDGYPNDGWPQDPGYQVIWAITTNVTAPWGDTVRVKVD